MRVLHLIKTPVGATWAVRQIQGLISLGIDVDVAIPDGPRAQDLRDIGATVHTINTDIATRNPREMSRRVSGLTALVEETRPDIVHSHFVGTTMTMRAAMRRDRSTRRVFQVPGPLHLENVATARLELSTSQESDRWISSCRWTQSKYRSLGVGVDRVALSYYGVDIDNIEPQSDSDLHQDLGIPPAAAIIGMVAYMYPPKRYLGQRTGLKGHEDLILAIENVVRSGSHAHLVFVGGAWNNAVSYESKVVAMGRERLGARVHFLGNRADVSSLYTQFDVAVHPSHSENVGGAVESLLAAVPTIATNVGGFPDVVIPGETGTLVPPHDPEQLAAAITRTLRDLPSARERALAGRNLVRTLFDVDRTSKEIADLYERFLSQPRDTA